MADTSIGTESNSTPTSAQLIPLSAAAKAAPGRPSANAIWRWCRKGVRARGGNYLRLKHVRLGGRVFTSLAWLSDFGEQLAAADAEHFDNRTRTRQVPRSSGAAASTARLAEIERELKCEGL